MRMCTQPPVYPPFFIGVYTDMYKVMQEQPGLAKCLLSVTHMEDAFSDMCVTDPIGIIHPDSHGLNKPNPQVKAG